MSIFQYVTEGLMGGAVTISKQTETAENTASRLRAALAPIENGAWDGEGSAAFIEDMRALIGQTETVAANLREFQLDITDVHEDMNQLQNTLINTITS